MNSLLHLLITSGVIGLGLPGLVAVVNQSHWPAWAKGVITALMALAAGLVTAAASHQFAHGWLYSAATVLAVASVAFHSLWKPTGWAPWIEAITDWASHVQPTATAPPGGTANP